MPLLLLLLGAAALPANAHARTGKYCRLISAIDVGKGVHLSGLRVASNHVPSPTLTRRPGTLTLCSYSHGKDYIAESSVLTMGSAAAARAEYRAETQAREADGEHGRKVKGSWTGAYQLGLDEIYVVKGRYLFHLQYHVPGVAGGTVRHLARKAARKL